MVMVVVCVAAAAGVHLLAPAQQAAASTIHPSACSRIAAGLYTQHEWRRQQQRPHQQLARQNAHRLWLACLTLPPFTASKCLHCPTVDQTAWLTDLLHHYSFSPLALKNTGRSPHASTALQIVPLVYMDANNVR